MNRPSSIFACSTLLASMSLAVACSDDDPAVGAPPDGGAQPDASSVEEDAAANDSASPGTSCSAALQTALGPVDAVSTGEVTVLATDGASKTLFVDATAGDPTTSLTKPRVYIDLSAGARVEISDVTAAKATSWDLAIKRSNLFTNGGDGGPGQGGSKLVSKAEEAVTAADATDLTVEEFVDETCTPIPDRSGRGVKTSFDDWYGYDQSSNHLTPVEGTYVVRGGTGKLFKVRIVDYYATPDGGTNGAAARYTLRVTPLDG